MAAIVWWKSQSWPEFNNNQRPYGVLDDHVGREQSGFDVLMISRLIPIR